MKPWSLVAGAFAIAASGAVAQVPSAARKITGAGSGGGGVGASVPAQEVTVSAVVRLTPLRLWKNTDGKELMAELVSWPVEGEGVAQRDLSELDIQVVRAGKVRLRKGGKIFPVLLTSLSGADQAKVTAVRKQVEKKQETPGKAGSEGAGKAPAAQE